MSLLRFRPILILGASLLLILGIVVGFAAYKLHAQAILSVSDQSKLSPLWPFKNVTPRTGFS